MLETLPADRMMPGLVVMLVAAAVMMAAVVMAKPTAPERL